MPLYPINIDIRNQLCVVIGGGSVARRKIEALLPCEPEIVVISPLVCRTIAELAQKQLVTWKQRQYQRGDLSGARLVFAATDNRGTQEQIVAEADESEILVNVVTAPEACSFHVPAMFRSGDLLITVATGGGSPALAARIRKELETHYGAEYGILLTLMTSVRQQIVDSSDVPAHHKRIFEKLLNSDILDFIASGQWAQLKETLRDILPPEVQVTPLVQKLQKQEKAKMEKSSC